MLTLRTLRLAAIAAALWAGAGAWPSPAAAAPVTDYTFTVNLVTGPLAGQTLSGSLSIAASTIPPGGGIVSGPALLTDLTFVFGGVTYDETTVGTNSVFFSTDGLLINIIFGNNCSPTCALVDGSPGFVFQFASALIYRLGPTGVAFGNYAISPVIQPVPVPSSLALALPVLAGLLLARSRRRAG
jgi:hypothetical protein